MISRILVLGGGSAGFIAAITLKKLVPALEVRLVRSPEIGIIGVGEGTTPFVPKHLHEFLQLAPRDFYERAQPTWKLGIRFLWGPREEFNYTFDRTYDSRWADLPRNSGFYCEDDCRDASQQSALMARDKAFVTDAQGQPNITPSGTAWHIENVKLVDYLEWQAAALGVDITDGKVVSAELAGENIARVCLESGEVVTADLYVDASGFHAKLIGETYREPLVSYADTLFCDRAVIGPRERQPGEPIQPFTTAETMDHGWCWRIDHEHHVNRGYVYSSAFVSDDEAEAEFRRKNPAVNHTRVVRFTSGRYRRSWIGNTVAVGNAAGFVEPLEATALMILCGQCRTLAEGIIDSLGEPGPAMVALYNKFLAGYWDSIRDFLAVHYRFNTRLQTKFWSHCVQETPLHGAAGLVEFYRENGPSLLPRHLLLDYNDPFGVEGYWALLVGQRVPHAKSHEASAGERAAWDAHRRRFVQRTESALSVADTLSLMRSPRWRWR